MMLDAHVCGKNRIIRKYPSVLCSLCKHGIDVILPEHVIDDYNNDNKNNKVNAKNGNDKTTRSS